jgi:hypothetical protein
MSRHWLKPFATTIVLLLLWLSLVVALDVSQLPSYCKAFFELEQEKFAFFCTFHRNFLPKRFGVLKGLAHRIQHRYMK